MEQTFLQMKQNTSNGDVCRANQLKIQYYITGFFMYSNKKKIMSLNDNHVDLQPPAPQTRRKGTSPRSRKQSDSSWLDEPCVTMAERGGARLRGRLRGTCSDARPPPAVVIFIILYIPSCRSQIMFFGWYSDQSERGSSTVFFICETKCHRESFLKT